MRLNERLNLVIPIYDTDDRVKAYVHSVPLSREAFEAHYLLIAKTFAAIHAGGLGEVAGPRVAAMVLRDVARRERDEEGAVALTSEVRRLTNVLAATPTGWDRVPYEEVVTRKALDDDDLSEVENALIFFMVASAMHRRRILREVLPGAASLWGAQTSPSDFTVFAASLGTSTQVAHTGVTRTPAAASSVPR